MRARRSDLWPKRNIVLVGLPGAGKSVVGRKLAQHIGRRFVDSDREIVCRSGLKIAEIFERVGEEGFRTLEAEVILDLVLGRGKVIALGGGSFGTDAVRDAVQNRCVSIWLDPPAEILLERVRASSGRPLFNGRGHEEVLAELMRQRRPRLAEAHIRITDETRDAAILSIAGALARMAADA